MRERRKMIRTLIGSFVLKKIRVERSHLWLMGICVIAGLLYLRFGRYYYVGKYNDDAGYILAAQGLLHGIYHTHWALTPGPIKRFWPGYPLFLSPFVGALAPHW